MDLKWLWITVGVICLSLTAWYFVHVYLETQRAFEALRESLSANSENFSQENHHLTEDIYQKLAIIETNGMQADSALITLAKLEDSTLSINAYIDTTISQLRKIGGWDEEAGRVKNLSETDKNYRFWLGANENANQGRGNGEAIILRNRLNGYAEWANSYCTEHKLWRTQDSPFPLIAVDPREDENIPFSSTNKGSSWEYFTFHAKPIIADLAMLEKYKMDVNEIEYQVLQKLKARSK